MKKVILIILGAFLSCVQIGYTTASTQSTVMKEVNIGGVKYQVSLGEVIQNKDLLKSLESKVGDNYHQDDSELYLDSWENRKKYQAFVISNHSHGYGVYETWYFTYDHDGKFVGSLMTSFHYDGDAEMQGKGEFITPYLYVRTDKQYIVESEEEELPKWKNWNVDIVEYQIDLDTGKIKELVLRKGK